MLNIFFDLIETVFSLWGRFLSFLFGWIGGVVSAVTDALRWIAVRAGYWPLTLFFEREMIDEFWLPLFCIVWAVLFLLLTGFIALVLIAYRRRKQ